MPKLSIVSLDDFGTYLGNPSLEDSRAGFILDLAETLCTSIVSPLPTGAEIVILDVAERAYANPMSAGGSSLGLYAEGEGPFSDVSPGTVGGGLFLTQENKATLRRLAGLGGAFMIDTAPAAAGQGLPWWDTGTSAPAGDWDSPA